VTGGRHVLTVVAGAGPVPVPVDAAAAALLLCALAAVRPAMMRDAERHPS